MIGSFCQLGPLADLAHRGEAVHLRHHDVHQHQVDRGRRLRRRCARARRAPRGRCARSRPWRPCGSSTLDSAKMLRTSSSTTRMRRPSSAASRSRASCSIRWRSGGSFDSTWCRNSVTSSSRRSGERAPLMMIELREAPQPLLLVARQRAAGVDDHRRERARRPARPSARAARSRCRSGRFRSMHHAVEGRRLRSCASASAARADARRSRTSSLAEQLRGCSRAGARRPRRPARGACSATNLRLELLERLDQLLALDRLERVADRAELERLLRVVGDRDDVHRDVARARVALELVEHAEAGVIGQADVEQDRARPVAARAAARPSSAGASTTHWKPSSCARSRRIAANARVVLDDQDAPRVPAPAARDRRRSASAARRRRAGGAARRGRRRRRRRRGCRRGRGAAAPARRPA